MDFKQFVRTIPDHPKPGILFRDVTTLMANADALSARDKVLLVDDLIATGGTAGAGLNLLRKAEADVVAATFLVDLPDLGGADRLRQQGLDVKSLMTFEGH